VRRTGCSAARRSTSFLRRALGFDARVEASSTRSPASPRLPDVFGAFPFETTLLLHLRPAGEVGWSHADATTIALDEDTFA
jgi:hypothetical protein